MKEQNDSLLPPFCFIPDFELIATKLYPRPLGARLVANWLFKLILATPHVPEGMPGSSQPCEKTR